MSIEEGFGSVHNALFGFGPDNHAILGTCTRCKKELRFSPVNGNCQPNCYFKFGPVQAINTIFNGAWVKFSWEAQLCDACLCSLSNWLLGDDWRCKEEEARKQ